MSILYIAHMPGCLPINAQKAPLTQSTSLCLQCLVTSSSNHKQQVFTGTAKFFFPFWSKLCPLLHSSPKKSLKQKSQAIIQPGQTKLMKARKHQNITASAPGIDQEKGFVLSDFQIIAALELHCSSASFAP